MPWASARFGGFECPIRREALCARSILRREPSGASRGRRMIARLAAKRASSRLAKRHQPNVEQQRQRHSETKADEKSEEAGAEPHGPRQRRRAGPSPTQLPYAIRDQPKCGPGGQAANAGPDQSSPGLFRHVLFGETTEDPTENQKDGTSRH